MTARRDTRHSRPPWSARQVLWWIWPTMPTSWSEVPKRLSPDAIQIARLTVAAVVSYVVADVVFPGILDLTAPLTALLIVQASTVGTLLTGLIRVSAVLTGVLVAVAVASFLGLTWWSLAAVIAASLILAKLLRLGEQTLEAPISAMLILAVSTPGLAGEVRVANTLIGTVVGIVFSLIVPVAIPNLHASESVRRVTRSQAALMNEIAVTLGDGPPHPEEVKAWVDWSEHIAGEVYAASTAVTAARESRRLNPRALATATVHPGLNSAVDRLERALAAERSLIDAIGRQTPVGRTGGSDQAEAELRRAFAVVLDDVATGLRAFGDLVEAEYGRGQKERADEALARMLEVVRETRAMLTELRFLDVDPREQTELWMLHGSVLAAIDHIVSQLDVEHAERTTAAWLTRRALPTLRTSFLTGRLRRR